MLTYRDYKFVCLQSLRLMHGIKALRHWPRVETKGIFECARFNHLQHTYNLERTISSRCLVSGIVILPQNRKRWEGLTSESARKSGLGQVRKAFHEFPSAGSRGGFNFNPNHHIVVAELALAVKILLATDRLCR